ncbi:MAG: hypothetical protein HFJ12_07330 [Bacilli bacterium]|nr:hypothetical protein [Bacilli bacterium]
MDYQLTNDEKSSIERYQDNDFKIMNSLLRSGIESEIRINSRNGKDYPFMTKTLMKQSLEDIKNLYSAIIKSYIKNGSKKPEKQLFRGTKQSLIRAMNNSDSSFLSATANINQTLTFSRAFNKGSKVADDSDRAVLLIDSDVPWISIENELGGVEDAVLFVPSKVQVFETSTTNNQRYGKEYIAKLTEIDVPIKSQEEIEQMERQILENTEKMSGYLKYIMVVKDNSNFSQNPRTLNVIKEYENWKRLVVEYNHQQYLIVKNRLMDSRILSQSEEYLSQLNSKVEQEQFMNGNKDKEKMLNFKTRIEVMKQLGFGFPNLDDFFDEKESIEDAENIEQPRRMM